jgi:hypothetical protein
MILKKILLIGAAMLSPAAANAAKQCVPCPAGTYSDGGTTGCKPCENGAVGKGRDRCIPLLDITEDYFEIVDRPPAGSCSNGYINPGIYRIVLGGGDGGKEYDGAGNIPQIVPAAKFTYNFTLGQKARYKICAGSAGKNGSQGAYNVAYNGSGGGGAGSFLELDVGNDTAHFIASGGAGALVHDPNKYICRGGWGGGLGNGTAGGIDLWIDIHGYEAYAHGAGGSNGSDNPAGYQKLSIKTLDEKGDIKAEAAKYYGTDINGANAPAPASHATNVPDPMDCTSCAILYKLRSA